MSHLKPILPSFPEWKPGRKGLDGPALDPFSVSSHAWAAVDSRRAGAKAVRGFRQKLAGLKTVGSIVSNLESHSTAGDLLSHPGARVEERARGDNRGGFAARDAPGLGAASSRSPQLPLVTSARGPPSYQGEDHQHQKPFSMRGGVVGFDPRSQPSVLSSDTPRSEVTCSEETLHPVESRPWWLNWASAGLGVDPNSAATNFDQDKESAQVALLARLFPELVLPLLHVALKNAGGDAEVAAAFLRKAKAIAAQEVEKQASQQNEDDFQSASMPEESFYASEGVAPKSEKDTLEVLADQLPMSENELEGYSYSYNSGIVNGINNRGSSLPWQTGGGPRSLLGVELCGIDEEDLEAHPDLRPLHTKACSLADRYVGQMNKLTDFQASWRARQSKVTEAKARRKQELQLSGRQPSSKDGLTGRPGVIKQRSRGAPNMASLQRQEAMNSSRSYASSAGSPRKQASFHTEESGLGSDSGDDCRPETSKKEVLFLPRTSEDGGVIQSARGPRDGEAVPQWSWKGVQPQESISFRAHKRDSLENHKGGKGSRSFSADDAVETSDAVSDVGKCNSAPMTSAASATASTAAAAAAAEASDAPMASRATGSSAAGSAAIGQESADAGDAVAGSDVADAAPRAARASVTGEAALASEGSAMGGTQSEAVVGHAFSRISGEGIIQRERTESNRPITEKEALKIGKALRLHLDDVRMHMHEFIELDQDQFGALTKPQFLRAVKAELPEDSDVSPEEHVNLVWRQLDDQCLEAGMDFHSYLVWYTTLHGIDGIDDEEPHERYIERLARRHRVPIPFLETVITAWGRFADVHTGFIEWREFESLMRSLLAPKSQDKFDLPENRLKRFWVEVDSDRDGFVTIEQFLRWYLLHFTPARSVSSTRSRRSTTGTGNLSGTGPLFGTAGRVGSLRRAGKADPASVQYYRNLASDRLAVFSENMRRRSTAKSLVLTS